MIRKVKKSINSWQSKKKERFFAKILNERKSRVAACVDQKMKTTNDEDDVVVSKFGCWMESVQKKMKREEEGEEEENL